MPSYVSGIEFSSSESTMTGHFLPTVERGQTCFQNFLIGSIAVSKTFRNQFKTRNEERSFKKWKIRPMPSPLVFILQTDNPCRHMWLNFLTRYDFASVGQVFKHIRIATDNMKYSTGYREEIANINVMWVDQTCIRLAEKRGNTILGWDPERKSHRGTYTSRCG